MLNMPSRATPACAGTERLESQRATRRHGDAGRAALDFEHLMLERAGRGAARAPAPRYGDVDSDGSGDRGASNHGSMPQPPDPSGPHATLPLVANPASPASPAAGAGDLAAVSPTRAVLEAVLATPAAAPAEIAAARWEVSIPQSAGPPLTLQADRAQPIQGTSAWTLDIRAGRDLQPALARSVPRLSERLEARSLHAHVRIERHRAEDE